MDELKFVVETMRQRGNIRELTAVHSLSDCLFEIVFTKIAADDAEQEKQQGHRYGGPDFQAASFEFDGEPHSITLEMDFL